MILNPTKHVVTFPQIILFSLLIQFSPIKMNAQEIGMNFNHNPEIIDFTYLEKVQSDWIRTTPRIFDYIFEELSVENDPALNKIIEAANKGYKIAFGFRWDFVKYNLRIPEVGSDEEILYFTYVQNILKIVGAHIQIFKLGNEPNLETLGIDMQPDSLGQIPLVVFTQRLFSQVIVPYYKSENFPMPDFYVGSFPRLFMDEEQNNPAVQSLIDYANNNDSITGLSVHLHISTFDEAEESFRFVRQHMPTKPIIIPEFSLHRLYIQKLSEELGVNQPGREFAMKHGYEPQWKLYQYFGYANTNRVTPGEWNELFATREWFPQHYLLEYYKYFQKYGVVLATYPILQQSCPKNMGPNSPAWFINPVFCQTTLTLTDKGEYSENPLCYDDYLKIIQIGKNNENNKH